ncbi:Glycosyltransferase family 2 protein [Enhydrobacter sp. AX1]|nr:glycosyltransferase family A protein [Enhydrobacter sp. AX1]VXB17482.1 Glycosyltransferase family 2 protein [Enhydrobacter sp. AX1]
MSEIIITVFTPTYNRAYMIDKLYDSLCRQTCKDFEWIVVDDGSVDNTEELIQNFIQENKIHIVYYKQKNQGKHIAINKGVELAKGELFFIVDSDDILPKDSLEIVIEKYQSIKDDETIAGLAGRRGYISGGYIGTNKTYDDVIMTSIDFRFKKKIAGDMAEVYKTKVIRQYPFPQFEGERFCPEALVWKRIDQQYKMLWFSDIIYEGEYIPDGLTANIFKVRKNSPKASCLYYAEEAQYGTPAYQKIKSVANYWRFSIYDNISFWEKLQKVSLSKSIIALPVIAALIIKDKNRG